MAWGRRKSGPKSAKKAVFLPVSTHFFFLSLSTVAFSHHHPHHRSFVHAVDFIFFIFFLKKSWSSWLLWVAFNVPNVHQIWQILDENDPLHFFYNPMCSGWAKWQYISTGDSLKMPTQSAFVCRFLTQDTNFEPMVGILPNWIKGWNFSLM